MVISVADTENWRRELARIAEMVGLVTADELAEIGHTKEPPPPPVSPIRKGSSRSANGMYSQRTGRWNETPKVISRSRSLRRRTPLSTIVPNHLFCVDEQEREMWVRISTFSSFFFLIKEILFLTISFRCFKYFVKF